MKLTDKELDVCYAIDHFLGKYVTQKQLGQIIKMDRRAVCRHVHALLETEVIRAESLGRRARYSFIRFIDIRAPVPNTPKRAKKAFAGLPANYFEDDPRAQKAEVRFRGTPEQNQTLGGVWNYGG